ncbi:hypothetical protein CYMTET_21818 [Cymbomonas tetramitiformis]|uniref:F-box domain-containing protein n=1 Tax=Cymbomonas tetramitiformis TaxID=36881 RepID=A0AAE0C2B0_9CHLO|nr:hypothetical protein CYMTET_44240 [Cymbomonas tetramitiformis]KAK3269753.1 hypothetical protein CYMTET_21818 [Cymbomonas tetramitiformis]
MDVAAAEADDDVFRMIRPRWRRSVLLCVLAFLFESELLVFVTKHCHGPDCELATHGRLPNNVLLVPLAAKLGLAQTGVLMRSHFWLVIVAQLINFHFTVTPLLVESYTLALAIFYLLCIGIVFLSSPQDTFAADHKVVATLSNSLNATASFFKNTEVFFMYTVDGKYGLLVTRSQQEELCIVATSGFQADSSSCAVEQSQLLQTLPRADQHSAMIEPLAPEVDQLELPSPMDGCTEEISRDANEDAVGAAERKRKLEAQGREHEMPEWQKLKPANPLLSLPRDVGARILSLLQTSATVSLLCVSRDAHRWVSSCLPHLNRISWTSAGLRPVPLVSSICRLVVKHRMYSVKELEGSLDNQPATLTTLANLLPMLPNLRQLSLSKVPTMNAKVASTVVRHCPQLHSLSLPACSHLSLRAIGKFGRHYPHLLHVDLSSCKDVGDDAVCGLAQACVELRTIKLNGCRLTDSALCFLTLLCPKLRELYVDRCKTLTDAGIKAVGESARGLEVFSCCKNRLITDTSLNLMLRDCLRLRRVEVSGTLCGYEFMALRMPALRRLCLSSCRALHDESLGVVTEGCPLLEYLDVGFCSQITTVGIVAAVSNCRKLRVLLLSSLSKLTDLALSTLATCCPELSELSIKANPCITDEGLVAVAFQCNQLQVVDIGRIARELTYCQNTCVATNRWSMS